MREKLIELLGADTCKHECCEDCEYCANMEACIEYLKTSMADYLIANGVTIPVRCKDCVSYQETMGKDSGKPCGYGSCFNPCAIITGIVYDEDFCSYGERRTDD